MSENIDLILSLFPLYEKEMKEVYDNTEVQREIWGILNNILVANDPEESYNSLSLGLCVNNFPYFPEIFKNSDIKIICDSYIFDNFKEYIQDFLDHDGEDNCSRPLLNTNKLSYHSNLFDLYLCSYCGNDCPCLIFNIKPGSCKLLLNNK